MLYSRSKDYMFRPVVVIIRSLSFDSLKIILRRFYFIYLFYFILILSESNDKDLMMATTGRNM
jgi:hypothetical protein